MSSIPVVALKIHSAFIPSLMVNLGLGFVNTGSGRFMLMQLSTSLFWRTVLALKW